MSQTLYVGGLPDHTAEDELKAVFVPFGTVLRVKLERRQGESAPSTFALVTMSSEQEAQEAFRAAGSHRVDGHPLTVVLLKDDALGALGAETKA